MPTDATLEHRLSLLPHTQGRGKPLRLEGAKHKGAEKELVRVSLCPHEDQWAVARFARPPVLSPLLTLYTCVLQGRFSVFEVTTENPLLQ